MNWYNNYYDKKMIKSDKLIFTNVNSSSIFKKINSVLQKKHLALSIRRCN